MAGKIFGPTGQHSIFVGPKSTLNGKGCTHEFDTEDAGDSLGRELPVSKCENCRAHLLRFHGWAFRPSGVKLNADELLELEEIRRDQSILQDRAARAYNDGLMRQIVEERKTKKVKA